MNKRSKYELTVGSIMTLKYSYESAFFSGWIREAPALTGAEK